MTTYETSAFAVELVKLCQRFKTGLITEKLEIVINYDNKKEVYKQDITLPFLILQKQMLDGKFNPPNYENN